MVNNLYVLHIGRYQGFFPGVVQRISIILQLPTEVGDRYGFLVIVFYMLFLGLFGVILLNAVKNLKAT